MAALPELKLMTLTIENGHDLEERISTLYASRRRLLDLRLGRNNRAAIKRTVQSLVDKRLAAGNISQDKATRWIEQCDRWIDAVARTEKRIGKSPKVRALMKGLAFLETTYNADTDTWHAHLHAMVSMRYMPQIVLTVLWRMASRNAGNIVDIRKITDASDGLRETQKYVTKAWEIPQSKHHDVLDALRGVKRITRIGNIKPAADEPTPCPGCNKPACECGSNFVAMGRSDEAIIPNVFYRTTVYDMGMSYEANLIITKDIHGHMVWMVTPLANDNLSTYLPSVSREGEHSPPQHAPPGQHEHPHELMKGI